MYIERQMRSPTELVNNREAHWSIGNKMPIHHIEMQHIDAEGFNSTQGILEVQRIDAHHRGRDLDPVGWGRDRDRSTPGDLG